MADKNATRTVDVWVVTDGTDDLYYAFAKAQSESFADAFNRHVHDDSERIRVERRTATIR
jgi:hypothetical protein